MVSKERKISSKPTTAAKDSHAQFRGFQTLISAIQSSEGLKPPVLKSWYCILVNLSLKESIGCSDNKDSPNCSDTGLKMEPKDRSLVAERLFEELGNRFETLFSALCDVSANRENGHAILGSDVWANVDELTLLLRCCMVILTLVDEALVLEKFQVLLLILGKLKSFVTSGGNEKRPVTFKKFISREFSFGDATSATAVSEDFVASISILEPSEPCRPFLCAILEVFADELSMHRLLREYFMLVDYASCTSRALFSGHFLNDGIASVLEVISLHFIISFSDEQGFEHFLNRLSCGDCKRFRVPDLSLNAAVSLLLNPIILSAPKMFQAHLILLVSEAIGVSMSSNIRPSVRLMTCYLTAFERSVILYTRFMSTLLMDGHPIGSKDSCANHGSFGRRYESSFKHHIHEVTNAKVCDVVCKSDSLWRSHLSNTFSKEKPDLLAESTAYINESQQGFDESCKNDISSILNSILLGAFLDNISDTVLSRKGGTSSQDICLIAAMLKLISSLMSIVFWCLRNAKDYSCLKALEDASSCKEYDFIVDVISCFRQFNVSLPSQKKLFCLMKTHRIRHKTTKWMLLHFSGLLSLSFVSGFDLLVKNCAIVIETLMNLYVFEEGNVVTMRSLLVSGSESFSSYTPPVKVEEALVDQKSSQKIVSKIKKIQTMCLRSESLPRFPLRPENKIGETSQNASILKCTRESTFGVEEETEESYNGKVYLQYLTKEPSKEPDYDELADFVECKPGKDYCRWLKDKERYRKWKSKKMAVVRWKKRRMTWKFMVQNKA
ncbi:uncharacterized protein LOC21392686 [Morus notabilis]|uniref:uncharacterized protein LOC21392686 n=1 Tax=Morus notabilis TaxID=981085 RepID=UPI000CED3E72|nr:uncharacterized protein LOC21392686 [Morus notabilis]